MLAAARRSDVVNNKQVTPLGSQKLGRSKRLRFAAPPKEWPRCGPATQTSDLGTEKTDDFMMETDRSRRARATISVTGDGCVAQ